MMTKYFNSMHSVIPQGSLCFEKTESLCFFDTHGIKNVSPMRSSVNWFSGIKHNMIHIFNNSALKMVQLTTEQRIFVVKMKIPKV